MGKQLNRQLLNGNEVPELDIPVTLHVYTKCPWKYKLIDMETGQEYIGQLPQEGKPDWSRE
jgi:hypothetical protein